MENNKINDKIIEILNKRGITEEKEIEEFLSPEPKKTYDPFLLLNMEEGVDLILSAIDRNDKICIYGDYDADGVTSVTLLMNVLSHLTENVYYYIPSRIEEGYGLNNDAIEEIYRAGTKLIVTVDCGSTSVAQVAFCKGLGMDILVTDHHQMTGEKPDCHIINPSQRECQYPFKYLAGVGVAFKLAQALVKITGLPKSILAKNLDVVAIGTIGDVVPLIDENRTIAKYGMRALKMTDKIGLKLLLDAVVKDINKLNSQDISFGIVPHINSAGRISQASYAAKLLLCKDQEEAKKRVDYLVDLNLKRKSMQEDILNEAIAIVEHQFVNTEMTPDDIKMIAICLDDAHEGVTGIVAGRLKDRYHVPTVIMTKSGDGLFKGTARSIESINLYELLKTCEDLFSKFGGHKAACGFSIPAENVDEFKKRVVSEVEAMREAKPDLLKHKVPYDIVVGSSHVTPEFVEELSLLEPFGNKNPAPKLRIDCEVENIYRFGQEKQFVGASVSFEDRKNVRCISFRDSDYFEKQLKKARTVSIIGSLAINDFYDEKTVDIRMDDVEPRS